MYRTEVEDDLAYMTPSQRDRKRRLELEMGTVVKKPKLGFLDVVKGQNEQEATIMSRHVTTSTGQKKPMYFSYVFRNVKAYSCNVCVAVVYGKSNLIHHHASKRHFEMMSRPVHPSSNFDRNQVANINGIQISLGTCYIKELLDQVKEPMLGLEYLVEAIETEDGREKRATYHCLLCDKFSECVDPIMGHLRGQQHSMNYLLLFFPKVYKKLVLLDKKTRDYALSVVCQKIVNDKQYSKVESFQLKEKLSLVLKRSIRYSIDRGYHYEDRPDKSFADDIFFNNEVLKKSLKHNVFMEFLVSEEESSINHELYRRRKGETTCKLCREVLSEELLEKIVHPYTGQHLANTLKGIKIYDKAAALLEADLVNVKEPLIGTEYMVEFVSDDTQQNCYKCLLCNKPMNNTKMVIDHLKSKQHQQRYIATHMPEKDKSLLKLPGPDRVNAFQKLFRLIEGKFPHRLTPWGTRYDLNERIDSHTTLEDHIKEKIVKGLHYGLITTPSGYEVPKIMEGLPEMPPPEVPKMKKKMGFPSTLSECSLLRRTQAHNKVREWLDENSTAEEPSQTECPTLLRLVNKAKLYTPMDNYDESHKCEIEFDPEFRSVETDDRSGWVAEMINHYLILTENDEEKFNICLKICTTCPLAKLFCIPICHKLFSRQKELVEQIEGSEKLNFEEIYWCVQILVEYALCNALCNAYFEVI